MRQRPLLGDDAGAEASGAAYVFVRDGSNWVEEAKLKEVVPVASSGLGLAVALHGDVALIGSEYADGQTLGNGDVHIFRRQGSGVWVPQAKLAGGGAYDDFGYAVALSGDVALIGAGRLDVDSGAGSTLDAGSVFMAQWAATPGQACQQSAQCLSGHCVDGLCCSTACDGGCGRCDTSGMEGTCTVRQLGEPARSDIAACDGYLCDGVLEVCPATCADDGGCAENHYCLGTCRQKLAGGEACSEDSRCQSGNCASGVCCDQPCKGGWGL